MKSIKESSPVEDLVALRWASGPSPPKVLNYVLGNYPLGIKPYLVTLSTGIHVLDVPDLWLVARKEEQ